MFGVPISLKIKSTVGPLFHLDVYVVFRLSRDLTEFLRPSDPGGHSISQGKRGPESFPKQKDPQGNCKFALCTYRAPCHRLPRYFRPRIMIQCRLSRLNAEHGVQLSSLSWSRPVLCPPARKGLSALPNKRHSPTGKVDVEKHE